MLRGKPQRFVQSREHSKGEDKMSDENKLTRREFIKGAAAVSASVATAGILASSGLPVSAAGVPDKWDQETDVVVVGYGGAGAAAAIAAFDAGAKVIILEKMKNGMEGGNSGVCGGVFRTPKNVEGYMTYIKAMCGKHPIPEDLVRAAAEEGTKNADWMVSLGGKVGQSPFGAGCSGAEFPKLPGAEFELGSNLVKADGTPGYGKDCLVLFKSNIEDKRKIPVLYETPGKELVVNSKGEVVGVIADSGGKSIAIKANRAVILTTGGFEYNDEMQRDYLVQGLETTPPILPWGTWGNTGDGIKMALSVGAELWHMVNQAGPYLGTTVPGIKSGVSVAYPTNNYIIVDRHGKRWFNEKESWPHGKGGEKVFAYDPEKTEYPRVPSYAIFDETLRKAGAIGPATAIYGYAALREGLKWSTNNQAEIDKGWILKAATIEELAKLIGADPAVLSAEVKKYNGFVDGKEDLDFQRPKESLAPIAAAPFYALKLVPVTLNTQGGPKRNAKAQVLRVGGSPVPRLYAAGELGSIFSFLYNCGGNFGIDCLSFGRIAGRNAAAEKPWTAA